jgi:Zn-dependent alcohol dehydrogenase
VLGYHQLPQHSTSLPARVTLTHTAVSWGSAGGLDKLELQTIPVPTPADGQVLIKVYAAGVNFSDTLYVPTARPTTALIAQQLP